MSTGTDAILKGLSMAAWIFIAWLLRKTVLASGPSTSNRRKGGLLLLSYALAFVIMFVLILAYGALSK